MFRLLFAWVLLTSLVISVVYLTDRETNREVGKWSWRILWSGLVTVAILAVTIFLERL